MIGKVQKPESVQKIDSLTLARELWELFSKTEQQSFFHFCYRNAESIVPPCFPLESYPFC